METAAFAFTSSSASLIPGKNPNFGTISGLEKSIRIGRKRELGSSIPYQKRSPLRPGDVSPRLPVPDHIQKPPYVGMDILPEIATEYQIHDSEGVSKMRAACELAARVLDYAWTLVRPSVTTDEIDKAVHQMIIEAGAYPSPLGYGGFPKSVCTSVNECMYHGIPDSRQLQDGDIINIDVTVYLNDFSGEKRNFEIELLKWAGWSLVLLGSGDVEKVIVFFPVSFLLQSQGYHGDTSKTFFCGNVCDKVKHLVKMTEECLHRGIAVCKDGALFSEIGNGISEHAEKYGYVVDRFVGHGVGIVFHSEPLIFNHADDSPGFMIEGQTFTIEPVLTLGSTDCITWEDNWTVLTADGSPAAQFEHTILITETGAEILTEV